jgi:hypothetical protein
LRDKSLNRTAQGFGETTNKKVTHEDTKSAYSFEIFGSNRENNPTHLIREKSINGDKVKAIQKRMKELVHNYLVENKEERKNEKDNKTGFFQKKIKKIEQVQNDDADNFSIQGIIKKLKSAQKTLHLNLVARYQSMVKFWEKTYLFRYSLVDYKRKKTFAQKKYLISKQEKNLIEMENLYGKRQAGFLRGTYMRESRSKYDQWEKRYNALQAKIDREIKTSEEQMFRNSFKYIGHFLHSDEDVSLSSLGRAGEGGRIGFDNVGQRQVFHYLLNALEVADLLASETACWVAAVEPFVGPKFQQQHVDAIRLMLDLLLEIFRTRVKHEDLLAVLQTEDKRVLAIMKRKVVLVPELVDHWYRNSTENQLLEIKVASLFSSFYHLSGNVEKSYILLAKAYTSNKKVEVVYSGSREVYGVVHFLSKDTDYLEFFPQLSENRPRNFNGEKMLPEVEVLLH